MLWRLVAADGCRNKHSDLLLVLLVFGVLAGSDGLGQPGRTLKEEDEASGTGKSPIIQIVRCKATPLVENEPNCLLCKEVWMSAICPKSRCEESSIELSLDIALGHFGVLLVLVFGTMVSCKSVRKTIHKMRCIHLLHCWPSLMNSLMTRKTSTTKYATSAVVISGSNWVESKMVYAGTHEKAKSSTL